MDLRHYIGAICSEYWHIGNEFCVYKIKNSSFFDYPIEIADYGCCVCTNGEIEGLVDLVHYRLDTNGILISLPGQLMEIQDKSDDFEAVGVLMSQNFVKNMELSFNFHLDQMLRSNPVVALNENQHEAMLQYCHMAMKILCTPRTFQTETLSHLTCAFFYGLGSYLYNLNEHASSSNDELLMQRFLAEVKQNFRKERQAQFYASQLCITPCYLSKIVKKVSGKSPTDWIEDYVVSEARALLKGTNLTILQISQQLGFPSQTFFGKFFKRVMGMSPKEYR